MMHLAYANLDFMPVKEFKFHPDRNWRFDFAWPEKKLAVELEGGIWNKGRHMRPEGFIEDCNKYNAASLLGWKVLRFTERHIKSMQAIKQTREALA